MDKLDTVFSYPFCNHGTRIECCMLVFLFKFISLWYMIFWRQIPSYWVFICLVMHLLLRLFMTRANFKKSYFLCTWVVLYAYLMVHLPIKKKLRSYENGAAQILVKIYQLDVHIFHLLNCCIIPNWNWWNRYVIFGGKNKFSSFFFMA